jgi:hypothetical protein
MYYEQVVPLYRCVKKGRKPKHERLSQTAIVDVDVFCRLGTEKWGLTNDGYARRKINHNGTTVNFALHTEVMKIVGKDSPSEGHTVDHISGDKLDNRVVNLRWATRSQQGVNRQSRPDGLPRGVNRRGKRFIAQVTRRSGPKPCHVYVGIFDTPEEASEAFERVWSQVYSDVLEYRRA